MSVSLEHRAESGVLLFNPPRDAEPSVCDGGINAEQNGEAEKPTVLTKLQKWADYPSVGNPVSPTRFLPMKTPMSLEIISNWSLDGPPKHSLTVPELLSSQAAAGRCVGMIIDLANHECLYAEDLPSFLEYTHIQLVAKVLPPREAIDEVAAAAREFWSRRPDDYIAIHCAYGFNRTGFVVCSYLCQVCGLTVPEALKSFAAARHPGVKHGKFVDQLYARYGGNEEDSTNGTASSTPVGGSPGTPTGLLGLHLRRASGSAAGSQTAFAGATWGSSSRRNSVDVLQDERENIKGTSTASDEGYPSSIPSGSSPAASTGSMPIPTLNQNRSARSLLTTTSSRSLTAVAETMEAEGTLDPAAVPAAPPCEDGPQWSAMAQHLDNQRLMRPSTSMGLAKALHEDFGVHDSTPSKLEPSPLMALVADEATAVAAAAAEAVAVDDARSTDGDSPAAPSHNLSEEERLQIEGNSRSHSPFLNGEWPQELLEATAGGPQPLAGDNSRDGCSSPNNGVVGGGRYPLSTNKDNREAEVGGSGTTPHSPTPPRPPLLERSTPPSVPSGQHPGWNIVSLSRRSPLLEGSTTKGLPRNASFESDCHSLGFNAREALVQLRSQDGFFLPGAGTGNNPGSIGSEDLGDAHEGQEGRKYSVKEKKERSKKEGESLPTRPPGQRRAGCRMM